MDVEQFISEVKAMDWRGFSGTAYYKPDEVTAALLSLACADEESTAGIYKIEGLESDLLLNAKIKSDVMYAIGNDHSGAYYPAVRGALPFIVQVALNGNHCVARNCAINILIDLYYFEPDGDEPELENYVRETIKKTIAEHRNNFLEFATDNQMNNSLIESLLCIADEQD
jgi:hypothetical protein